MARFKISNLIIGKNEVTIEHPLLKEFVKLRNKEFTDFYGPTSRYNIGKEPRVQDKIDCISSLIRF